MRVSRAPWRRPGPILPAGRRGVNEGGLGYTRCAMLHDPQADLHLASFLLQALAEDLGAGDVTTEATIPRGLLGRAEVVAKAPCVLAGVPVAAAVFSLLDPRLAVRTLGADGEQVAAERAVLEVRGRLRSILGGERVALNLLSHLSGIATLTRRFVERAGAGRVRLLDTRKTTPNMRGLEKMAVRAGGGENHRFGLFDRVLIKDNHIEACGGVAEAIRRARAAEESREVACGPDVPAGASQAWGIEVEVGTPAELEEAIAAGADMLLLDNMDLPTLRESVRRARTLGKALLEASGNVTLDNVAEVAATGVDFISVGALTHSAPAADFSLRVARAEGDGA